MYKSLSAKINNIVNIYSYNVKIEHPPPSPPLPTNTDWNPDAPDKISVSCTAGEKQQILETMRRLGKQNISAYMVQAALGPEIQEMIKQAVEDAMQPHREHKQKELETIMIKLDKLLDEVGQLKKK